MSSIVERIEAEDVEWMMCGKQLHRVFLGKKEMEEYSLHVLRKGLVAVEAPLSTAPKGWSFGSVSIVPTDAESEFRAKGE